MGTLGLREEVGGLYPGSEGEGWGPRLPGLKEDRAGGLICV